MGMSAMLPEIFEQWFVRFNINLITTDPVVALDLHDESPGSKVKE